MGYGKYGAGEAIPGGATLNFDVEVVEVTDKEPELPKTSPLQLRAVFDATKSGPGMGIALVVALAVCVGTLIEFHWKLSAAEMFQKNKADLATFFGIYYCCVFLLTSLLQYASAENERVWGRRSLRTSDMNRVDSPVSDSIRRYNNATES